MSPLEQAEQDLAAAEAVLKPLDTALQKAHNRQLKNYAADRRAVLDLIAVRDPARITVMNLQDLVADLRTAEGGPPTIGKANRG